MQADAGFLNHVQAGRLLTQAGPGRPERRISEWRPLKSRAAGRAAWEHWIFVENRTKLMISQQFN
jgi:hypothetical protein